MSKIDITKTELVWPGKYNDDGTRNEVPRVTVLRHRVWKIPSDYPQTQDVNARVR